MMAGDGGIVTPSGDLVAVVVVDRCQMRFLTETGRSATAMG